MLLELRFFFADVVPFESFTVLKYDLSSLLYVPFLIEALSENRLYKLVELFELPDPNIELVEFQKFIRHHSFTKIKIIVVLLLFYTVMS